MGEKGQWSNWYADRKWRAKRKVQLDREPLCRFCLALGKVEAATICDHVVPHRGDRESFWKGEVQSLCAQCHSSAKQSLEATGVIQGVDTTGFPIDPSHHWRTKA